MLPLNLYARVRVFLCAIAHETAGAARTRSSLRPRFRERANEMQTSGAMRRENVASHAVVIPAQAGNQYSRGSSD
jgi:hypothetical protein